MKGICFKEPLFHATIEGGKTQTRRVIKSRSGFFNVCSKNGVVTDIWQCDADGWNGDNLIPVKPRYQSGDIVYLKEPYVQECAEFERTDYIEQVATGKWLYRYAGHIIITNDKDSTFGKWKNKLFMPESAARHFIRITAVRAERLQDISDEDCFKEGIYKHIDGVYEASDTLPMGATPREAYAALIDKINGKGTWDSNPWVWVYDYELTEKPE